MTDDSDMTDGAETPAKPKIARFRKSNAGPKLSPESAKRQGEITHLAFNLLGGSAPTLSFLNDENAELGGRPIDIAMIDAEGFARVEQVIRKMAAGK
jgi:hypothetical protein